MIPNAAATDLVVTKCGRARFFGREAPCAVGRGGFLEDKREGDGASPIGVFRLEFGYYRPDRIPRPDGPLNWLTNMPFLGWSDDPTDKRYNQPVRRPHPFRHEKLRRPDPLYDLVVVFDANRAPIEPGKGSALFLHVWRKARHPTEGCIAFRRQDLLWIVERWTPRSRLRLTG